MDKAIQLLQTSSDRLPGFVKEEVDHLRVLHEEKFASIAVQFAERDTRTEQTSRDSKVAVDAALQAAKEAVGEQNKSSALAIAKSETATTKQIDQIGSLISTTSNAFNDKVDDIKGRLTIIEGKALGGSASLAIIFSVIAALAAIGSVIAVMLRLTRLG